MAIKKHIHESWHNNRQLMVVFIVAFFLLAGVVQYAVGLTYVIKLTSLVIAIMTALAVIFWDVNYGRRLLLSLIAIITGIVVELIGVNTGLLFGDYQYGTIMGYKIAGVPLLIGATWLLVTVSAWQIVSFSSLKSYQKILIASGLVVMFDLLLEQFATAFGLWVWDNGVIPLLNYASWFFVSVFLLTIYAKYSKQVNPSLFGAFALPLMAIFFWLMLLIS
jgi:putative membrane protein